MTKTLLLGTVGSVAYGLNGPDSDTDRLGVFAAPTLEIAGLNWSSSRESNVAQGPDGDDFAEHEVGKFFRLCLRGNPTVQELLWIDNSGYDVITDEGRAIRNIRQAFLSKRAVWDSYRGYATAQLRKYSNGFPKAKYAKHCLRLIEQGKGLYRTGNLRVRVADPQKYTELAGLPNDKIVARLTKELDEWTDTICALPDEPDRRIVEDVLQDIRIYHI